MRCRWYTVGMENPKKSIAKKIEDTTRKTMIAGATALSTLGPNAMAATNTEIAPENKDIKATEEVVAAKPDVFSDNTTTPEGTVDGLAYMSPENKGDDDKKESKENTESRESVSLDLAAYFETGSAELKPSDIERIQTAFSDFLKTLPEEVKADLQAGEMTIVVEAGCSPARIKSAITETINGVTNTYLDNADLARARANSVTPLLQQIVESENLSNIHFDVLIPADGISKSKEKKVTIEARYNHDVYMDIFKESFNENTLMVIMDESGSMKDKRDAANEVVDQINETREVPIEIRTLQGGNTEAHLKTMEDVIAGVDKQDGPKYIYVITDEMDETLRNTDPSTPEGQANIEEYKRRIRAVVEAGQKKNVHFVVHYMNNGITKTTEFKENPDVLLDTQVIEKKDSGVVSF